MSFSGRGHPPSPRTLHERLGLDQHQQHQPPSNTLLDRVQGVKARSEGRATAARSAAWSTQKSNRQDTSSIVGQDRQPASASATPLQKRIAQDSMSWPARGRQAPYIPAVRQPSASSGPVLDYGEDSRHIGPSNPSVAAVRLDEVAPSSNNTEEGPIRVSEDGEVWRSPPHRPVQHAARSTEQSGSRTTSAPSSMSLSQSIDLTIASEDRQTGRPGFSPLPPFARASSGSASNEAVSFPYKGVPAQGFRRSSGFDRAASRPPQIASSSGSSRHSAYTSAASRRMSQPYPTMPSYQERQYPRAQVPSTDNVRSRYDSYSNEAQRNSTYYDGRPSREAHRSPAILASPASSKGSSQIFGEEIPIDTPVADSRDTYGNRTWTRPQSPHRPRSGLHRVETGLEQIPPKSPPNIIASIDRPSTSSGLQTSKPAAELSTSSRATPTITLPARPGAKVKVEAKSADFHRPPSSSSSAVISAAANASSSASTVQYSAVQGGGRVGEDGFRQPVPSTTAIKREPRSPPGVPRISLPPQPLNATPQALFNPFTQSPEERKPVIRHGFTPPPRLQLPANSSESQNAVSHKVSPPAPSKQGPPPLARDVAQAHAERVQGKAGGLNVAAAKGSSPQSQVGQIEVPCHSPSASTSRIASASTSPFSSSRPEPSMDLANKPLATSLPVHSTSNKVSWDDWQPEMEVDELAPSSPVVPATQLVATPAAEPATRRKSPKFTPPSLPHSASSSIKSGAVSTSTSKGKGKQREREPLHTSLASRGSLAARSSSAHVIDLASEDDEDEIALVKPSRPQKALNARAVSPIQSIPLPPRLPVGAADIAAVQSLPIPLRPVPGEERTRVFPLPPKVLASIQPGGKRPRAALRNFLDSKYEELEVELKSPLQRIDEIPRDDTIRLVYIELELHSTEVAIPLPQDCLRLAGSSPEEREQRRSAFQIQQIVRFAKEGREAENTRFTPAYLIVVFQTGQQPVQSTSAHSTALYTASQRASTKDTPTSSIPPGIVDKQAKTHLSSEIQKEKEKKRKRLSKEVAADDTASISSLDSTASETRKKDKGPSTKQARKSFESQTHSGTVRSVTNLPSTLAPKHVAFPSKPKTAPALPNQTTAGSSSGSSSAGSGLKLANPRLVSVMHSMHGSLSNKLKDCREKPRMLFKSERVGGGYIAVSMRGHLHYWKGGLDEPTVISEDRHTHPALSVQAALWSDEYRLAVLAYTPNSAAAIANVQIVKMHKSKATIASRRTYIRAHEREDKTGLSALAWDPSSGTGLRMAGAEQTDRRLRLWSVDPGDSATDAKLTCLHNITTHHTNAIRSILWQPESNKIFTGGADKRVCTIDARTSQTVDEWKENLSVNRIYRRDENLVLLCLAGNRDQFRCVDLRTPRSVTAITFSQQTKKGESLGQYPQGDIMNDYFAYPVEDELHIWDLRNTRHLTSIAAFSGVIQARYETTTKLALLEKKHLTTLNF